MRHLRLLPAPAALLFALCLTGCGPVSTQTVLAPRLEVPDALLVCRDRPEPPATISTDTDLTDWLLDVVDAGEDCRTNLRHVSEIVHGRK